MPLTIQSARHSHDRHVKSPAYNTLLGHYPTTLRQHGQHGTKLSLSLTVSHNLLENAAARGVPSVNRQEGNSNSVRSTHGAGNCGDDDRLGGDLNTLWDGKRVVAAAVVVVKWRQGAENQDSNREDKLRFARNKGQASLSLLEVVAAGTTLPQHNVKPRDPRATWGRISIECRGELGYVAQVFDCLTVSAVVQCVVRCRGRGKGGGTVSGQSVPGRASMWGSAALLLLLLADSEAGVRKRWTPSWDLTAKNNWKEEKLPCGGGIASLPRYPENSLFLGADLTLGSLDLPIDGEIILGEKARFLFDHTSSGDCADAEWTHRGPIFPALSDSLFTVQLAPPVISVTTLSVGNRNFTTSELAAYVRTPEGAMRFRGISSSRDGAPLYVESPGECTDVTGLHVWI
ncbi:hypothetical protein O3P69_020198 [Scylla paramamosain]|uniref:Protein amnionless n=1 Tax=Scylla paramamosain TaxID=85552 RepID=A0AAW0TKT9_SCYPA